MRAASKMATAGVSARRLRESVSSTAWRSVGRITSRSAESVLRSRSGRMIARSSGAITRANTSLVVSE